MMKNILLAMILLAAVPVAHAALTDLPDSTLGVDGISYFDTGTVSGRIEYAVYLASDMAEFESRSETFVYAYQLFASDGVDTIDSLSILGIGSDAVSGDSALGTTDVLDGTTISGVDASTELLGESSGDLEALYSFDDGAVVVGQNSFYLLIFSDYSPVTGSYEIEPTDSSIAVPGDDAEVPEPATLVLLLGGGLLSLCRRK